MKLSYLLPQDQVFWYVNKQDVQSLRQDLVTDVVVIGGGMAGLSAAQSFADKGCKVVLVEKNYCGSGATGKSSGFITPDSELSLRSLIDTYGADEAQRLWGLATSGVTLIKNNITNYNLDCDYQLQDTCVVANTKYKFRNEITPEHNARIQLNYPSALYEQPSVQQLLGSDQYTGAVTYGGTFGIHAYQYCLGMKQVLQQMGVQIYEETPVIEVKDRVVKTPSATITAQHIIVCADRFAPALDLLADKIYQVQTFLMLSAPLTPTQIKKIFPERPLMVWDTDLIYHYFRLTGDNRLMLGGASLLYTYASHEKHNNMHMAKKLQKYFQSKFSDVDVQFEYIWPGLIGISKDLFPLAGPDESMPSVYYIAAAAGLPWAAALGKQSAERILNKREFDLSIEADPWLVLIERISSNS